VFAVKELSLLNCVICGESGFAAELCCLQRIGVRYRITVCAANERLSSNYCVVYSKSLFAAEL